MAWFKERNKGEGGNAVWTQVDSVIWTTTVVWTGTTWDKEVRPSASFTLESKAALKDIWNTTLSNWEDTNQGRWNSGWLKES
jgi:hypothetical protein